MPSKTVMAIAALMLGSGVARAEDYVLHLAPGAKQQSRYDDGRRVVDDASPTTRVRVFEPKQQTPRRTGFRVLVLNGGSTPFDFGPENVRVRLPDGTVVAMIDYAALMREQRHREKWQAIAAGLGAMGRSMQASSAGYASGSYSGNTVGTVGSTPFQANTVGTFSGYDSGAAAIAQQNANAANQAEFAQMRALQEAQRASISTVLKTTTVDPGTALGGVLQYDVPASIRSAKGPVPVVLEITTGTEVHSFAGTLDRYRK